MNATANDGPVSSPENSNGLYICKFIKGALKQKIVEE